jgi:PEGA domain
MNYFINYFTITKTYFMKRKNFHWAAVLFAGFLISSCATLFTGTKDDISFKSTPSGAVIYKDGIELCKTPCSLKMKRSIGNTNIEMKLDGYETRVFKLDKTLNIVSVVNMGNLLGWAIDAATGAVMKYDRKEYNFELSKNKRISSIQPEKIYIDTKKNIVDIYVSE